MSYTVRKSTVHEITDNGAKIHLSAETPRNVWVTMWTELGRTVQKTEFELTHQGVIDLHKALKAILWPDSEGAGRLD